MKTLHLIKEGYTNDAASVLIEAGKQEFEEVFILGIKDGTVHTIKSKSFNRIKSLGAIEAFKMHLWNSQ